MVLAWYMDSSDADQRLEHHRNPPAYVSLDQVKTDTGVLYTKLDIEDYENKLNSVRAERGYTYSDFIEISPERLPNYEERIKCFYEEHLHTDEEIRFVISGTGYFDIRNKANEWIRIRVEPGDLLILPAGIYHRFTLDTTNYIKVIRLFVGEPVWTPHNRPADDLESRKMYVTEQQLDFPSLIPLP